MPLIETKGAASAQGFGEFAASSGPVTYIEDVFSTYLYTGNSSTQTITNGIDLSTKGGLVWIKARSQAYNNLLSDSANGPGLFLVSNSTAALSAVSAVTDFTSSGFQLPSYVLSNQSGTTFASWTFRKQAKFFDVVTYTGNGTAGRTVAHSLGSVPGCIVIKRTDTTSNWPVYHRALSPSATKTLHLNLTNAEANTTYWSQDPTSSVFYVDSNSAVNASGGTYVAYLFAHDAGGFGLTGTDNVISCGSVTSDGNRDVVVNLGWEPQWVLFKSSSGADDWTITDNMRGLLASKSATDQSPAPSLEPNLDAVEANNQAMGINATGFNQGRTGSAGQTYIYIAIRRGPMKVPTSGTSVFTPLTYVGNSTQGTLRTAGFTSDVVLSSSRTAYPGTVSYDRLRGAAKRLATGTTGAEVSESGNGIGLYGFDTNVGYFAGVDQSRSAINWSGNYVNWIFQRAPNFFDEVCYTGDGSSDRLITHNLGVTPTFIIVKNRGTASTYWSVYHIGAADPLVLNTTAAANFSPNANNGYVGFGGTNSTVFQVSGGGGSPPLRAVNESSLTYVAYLFATCPGVSKVDSYTGTGATQTISCGFTGGARFVLIKRIDSTGDWYVWDTARGMVSGTDPNLQLNTTNAETNTNSIYTTTGGFQIVSTAAGINASGGTYIFLAIA